MTHPHLRTRRSLPGAIRLLAGLTGLVLLWSAAWWLAARGAGIGLDRWIAAEAVRGRAWTCPDRRVDGYPFALALHCSRPTFAGEIAGHRSDGQVETLKAGVSLLHPATIAVLPQGPLYLRADDDSFDLVVSWAAMDVGLTGLLGGARGASVTARRLAATLATPEAGNLNLRSDLLSGSAAGEPDGTGSVGFDASAEEVSFPAMPPLPGLDGPMSIAARGVLARADLLSAPTARALEDWRRAGAGLTLAALTAKTGAFTGTASGRLGLDGQHRPAGRLDTALTGFEPIARQFGIPLAGVQLGGLLGTLLGGGAPREPGAITLPLLLAEGRVMVGPLAVGPPLRPLY